MRRTIGFLLAMCFLIFNLSPLGLADNTVTKSNADVIIKVGEKYTLEAVLKYMMENNLPLNIKVNWTTSDSKVATVAGGVVTGVSEGGATIKATASNNGTAYEAQAKVYVVSTVTGVTLNKNTLNLKVGQSEKLVETVLPDTAIVKKVTYKTEDSKVATVSSGTVKGISPGTTKITVTTTDGGYTAVCTVTVVSTVTGIMLQETVLDKFVGEEFTLLYTVLPAEAVLKDVKWTSSEPSIVSVSGGKCKVLSGGVARIKVQTVDGGFSDICTVTATPMVTGITLNKESITLMEGEKEVVAATVLPATALMKDVAWKSDNSKVASVSGGLITAVGAGETIISAVTKDGGFKASVAVDVRPRDIKKIDLLDLVDNAVGLQVGESKWFLYKTYPVDVVPTLKATCTMLGKDKSSPLTIKNGAIYWEPDTAGDYVITLTDTVSGLKDTCGVSVTSIVTGVKISAEELLVYVGEKAQLTGNALPEAAIIKGVTWKSDDASIARVNANTGEIIGVAEGVCYIVAKTIDGGMEKSCKVTVKNPLAIETIKLRDADGNIIGEEPAVKPEPVPEVPKEITIFIDGKQVVTDQPPIIVEGRTLAPVRAIFENLGATMFWNDATKSATGIKGTQYVKVTIDSNVAEVNGDSVQLDVPATIINSRTMVPVRFIAESLGVKVDWDAANRSVLITTKG